MDLLIEKILALFKYRQFDHLYHQAGWSMREIDRIQNWLIRLQQDIYFLDEYLESNWQLDPEELKLYWNQIHQSLSYLGIPSSKYDEYSAHIYKYQRHEEQIRGTRSLLRLSMEYFYFYKSCDVKLLRRIIYIHAPQLSKYYKLSDWRYFDLITEVNDDVEDLLEDLSCINGNRLMMTIEKRGIESARQEFIDFIDQISIQSEARARVKESEHYDFIHALTMEQVVETKKILEVRLEEYIDYTTSHHIAG